MQTTHNVGKGSHTGKSVKWMDMEKVITGCENWVKNHKDEDLLLAYSAVCELLALLKEQDERIKELELEKGWDESPDMMGKW